MLVAPSAPPGDGLAGEEASAFWIAALREAFEETGFLLAWRVDGSPVDTSWVPGVNTSAPSAGRVRA